MRRRAGWPSRARNGLSQVWSVGSQSSDPPMVTSPALSLSRRRNPSQTRSSQPAKVVLGGVDGFDEDEAESKGHHGTVVLGRLLAAQRHALEALELAHELLDAGAGAIERLREERWSVPGG